MVLLTTLGSKIIVLYNAIRRFASSSWGSEGLEGRKQ